MSKLKLVAFKIPEDTYKVIDNISKKNKETLSDTLRRLVINSLNIEWFNDNNDLIARLIRDNLELVLKPHVERLAKISAKAGHASAATMFLNAQALKDLVPTEKSKEPREMLSKAKQKAAIYMQKPVGEINEEFLAGNDESK